MDAWADYASEFHAADSAACSADSALVAADSALVAADSAVAVAAAQQQMPRQQFLRELADLVKAELAGQAATGHACFLLTRRIRY